MTWLGLITAYYSPYPIGFYVTTFAFAAYLTAHLPGGVAARTVRRRIHPPRIDPTLTEGAA